MGRKRAYPEQHSGIPACPQARIEAAATSISHTVNPQKPIIGSMAVAETRSSATEMTAGGRARNIFTANWVYTGSDPSSVGEWGADCSLSGRVTRWTRNVAWRTHRSQGTSG